MPRCGRVARELFHARAFRAQESACHFEVDLALALVFDLALMGELGGALVSLGRVGAVD